MEPIGRAIIPIGRRFSATMIMSIRYSRSEALYFDTLVTSAAFCKGDGRWTIVTSARRLAKARFLIGAVRFAVKAYTPEILRSQDLTASKEKSIIPQLGRKKALDVRGKRCAVIGTGASGVHIARQRGSENVEVLTAFQRTPNLALFMAKRDVSAADQERLNEWHPDMFHHGENCYGGFTFDVDEQGTFEATEGKRLAKPKLAFGIKRSSAESSYYDMFNRPNIDVVDITEENDIEFVENGIKTKGDGKVYEMATGFDLTGSLTSTGIMKTEGIPLATVWASSATPYLRIMIPKHPNFFYLYGPYGPCSWPTDHHASNSKVAG
ncbi:hypothetical protein AC579_1652 [Pseudocercospora musae]|uniref:L-ornithine N(5)-oxygenase n=1 Tax=Pseudocercospora musae TaxID=113226 RepID=A0A139IB19_9PEZI|nr:hypothetical protein AC579_1652 [Pseudocercospora musae]